MAGLAEAFGRAIRGRHPIISIETNEEERVLGQLRQLAAQYFSGGTVTTWSCVRGMDPPIPSVDTRDPLAALSYVILQPRRGLYVMKDLAPFLADARPARALREIYMFLRRDYPAAVVLLGQRSEIPPSLEREVCSIEAGAPSAEEVQAQVAKVQSLYPGAQLTAELQSQLVLALRGLALHEAEHVLHRAFSVGQAGSRLLDEIFQEKAALAKRSGFLEFVPLRHDLTHVGGHENVKDWALKRKQTFTQEAVKAGVPVPKGVLIMGIAGCGKSLLAKSIAGLWQVPLFRLDMSMVFSGVYGSPEATFARALKTVEDLAPAVLWIDEMEASLSTPKDIASPQSMVFSNFLTWMQEKPPLIFVAATANRIENLPAEIIRKGRFDQVFFCDLPNEDERKAIINLHLAKNGMQPGEIQMDYLLYRFEGWSGAEIEQAIIAARIETLSEKRRMTADDIRKQASLMVPLSTTMAEQIKQIRDWAQTRATPASKPVAAQAPAPAPDAAGASPKPAGKT
ncbi:MAG: AAA family ATPase [Elusimicrobia bacterium]|nr:AAA family ATPase [Elusimicrobiota bacterium]